MTKAEKVVDRLIDIYGQLTRKDDSAFHVLVRTILSQNTNDRNMRVASGNLFSRFKTPEEISNADLGELATLLRPGGLHNVKAKRIMDISKLITKKYGDLDKVVQKNVDAARKDLLSIKGIGPKTADCVLLFAGSHNVLPVDTHVFRVAHRLGLAPQNADHEAVKAALESKIPSKKLGSAHNALIAFGREYCRARNPRCDECPLEDLCKSKILSSKTISENPSYNL